MKFLIKIILFGLFFSLSVFSLVAFGDKQKIPSAVARAAQATVKIKTVYPNGEVGHGTGFIVKSKTGRVFIVTDFHVAQEFSKGQVKVEAFSPLKLTGVMDFSLLTDLFLFEVADYKGPTLPLAAFNAAKDTEAYLLGFPLSFSGNFKQLKIKGLGSLSKTTLSGFSYFSHIKGSSGGPLLNKEGAVIGVTHGEEEYLVYFMESHFVESLLKKTENQKSKANLIDRFEEEVNSLLVSAKAGDSEAQDSLSTVTHEQRRPFLMHIDSKLLDDVGEGGKWSVEAYKNKHTRTLYTFGRFFFLKGDYETARQIWELAANQGHPLAPFKLSSIYMNGQNGPADFEKGLFWLKKAVEREDPVAVSSLAVMHINGTGGLTKDVEKGRKMLSELAEEGFTDAMEALKKLNLTSLKKEDSEGCPSSLE